MAPVRPEESDPFDISGGPTPQRSLPKRGVLRKRPDAGAAKGSDATEPGCRGSLFSVNRGRSAALALLLSGALSCGLFVSFDDFDTSVHQTFTVGGTVDGLEEGTTATASLNGEPRTLERDGDFTFPGELKSGEAYVVEASADQPGMVCSVERGAGTMGDGKVDDVAIRCGSTTELTSLVLSAGPLSSEFAPRVVDYEAEVAIGNILPGSTTVTATARAPGAKIEIAGALVPSGAPSAPIPLALGETKIAITVTAPDGGSRTYTVDVIGKPAPTASLRAPVTQRDALFGDSVAIWGDTLVIGSPGEASDPRTAEAPETPKNVGAVYVYRRDSGGRWKEEERLLPPRVPRGAAFGRSVAISGDTLVVGADGESADLRGVHREPPASTDEAMNSGAAYVFVRKGGRWSHEAYLKASNTAAHATFGAAVALSEDTIVVGAPTEASNATGVNGDQSNSDASGAGAAYVFVRASGAWSQQAYLKASNANNGAGKAGAFGSAVAIDGDTVVVGASSESGAASGINGDDDLTAAASNGAAFVFHRTGSTWAQQAYVKPSNTHTKHTAVFGGSVTISGDTMAIGARLDPSKGPGVDGDQAGGGAEGGGAVYVFVRASGAWRQQAFLKAEQPRQDGHFGASVSLSGPLLAVGSPGVARDAGDTSRKDAGTVYLYERAGASWAPRGSFMAPNPQEDARLGERVALSEGSLVAGASGEPAPAKSPSEEPAAFAGAAYVFR